MCFHMIKMEMKKYIEVKTTKGGLNNIFHISENEVEFSEQYKVKYYLYRVYNFNQKRCLQI